MEQNYKGPTKASSHVGIQHPLTFNQILKRLEKDIEWYAHSYPLFWRKDIRQEGRIAIFDAYLKFTIVPEFGVFRRYVLSAIKRRMIDFYRKNLKYTHLFIELPPPVDDCEQQKPVKGETVDQGFSSDVTFGIDYEALFSERNLKSSGFSDQEIEAFNLHFEQHLKVTDVAEALSVSIGQASKIVSKVREKSESILRREGWLQDQPIEMNF